MEKIDIFNHIFPEGYFRRLMEVAPKFKDIGKRVRGVPMLMDLDVRFQVMDQFGDDYRQILSLASPPLEVLGEPEVSTELARVANDGMAELVDRHPDRFPGFVASLPMNDVDASIAETRRAIGQLGAVGVQAFTNVAGKPLDLPEFLPLFDAIEASGRPLWVHPARGAAMSDYATEDKSRYEIWWTFGWPYETSAMMARLVFSGILDRCPELKVITHHMGGMVPYFEGRVGPGWDQLGSRTSDEEYAPILQRLKKPHLDYFRMFYADTAVFGSASATRCGLDFFGVDHVLFASDAPFDPEKGPMYIRETIRVIDELEISDADRRRIYRDNAVALLGLESG